MLKGQYKMMVFGFKNKNNMRGISSFLKKCFQFKIGATVPVGGNRINQTK